MTDLTSTCARYGVSIDEMRTLETWEAVSARRELAWRWGKEGRDPAKFAADLGLTARQARKLAEQQQDLVNSYQEEAQRQHQTFLASDEAAHIRAELAKAQEANARLEQEVAFLQGYRGKAGVRRADGFTESETEILRIMVTRQSGEIHHEQNKALARHICNIRKKVPEGVTIITLVGEGYRMTEGREIMKPFLLGAKRDDNVWKRPSKSRRLSREKRAELTA